MTEYAFARLIGYARPHWRQVTLASICSVLNKIFDLAPPILIGVAVDIVVRQENSWLAGLGITELRSQLLVLGLITVVIWLLESAFQYAYGVLWRNLAQTFQHELRLDAYGHVQGLEMAYFEDRSTGGLLAILNDDINQLERFLDHGANDLLQLVTTVIVVGGLFIVLVPGVAWMALLPMPLVVWGSMRFQRRLAPRYAAVREQVGLLNGQLANNLGGIATIKSFTAEPYEQQRIRRYSQAYGDRNRSAISLSSAFVPVIRMIISAGFVAIMVFGGYLALSGELNIGAYSTLIFMTQRLLWPLTRLGETLDLYQRAMASTTRVLDLLDTEPRIVGGHIPLPVADIRGGVRFENVSFHYELDPRRFEEGGGRSTGNGQRPARAPQIINNISLQVEAGQTVAIVGATGSGKSTLVKLLLRFYDVQAGAIRLDGRDIRQLELSHLRRAIGFVSQDVFLFHGTVSENIDYGTFSASPERIVAAARVAEAHDFIMELPHGYQTIVGERGQKLSGGQRQRLSIARAVLKDPPVLILDEATSAVDNETEAAIQRSMERITVGRTTIVIAHRLSTVRNADHIFVLDHGRLLEEGRHEELVGRGGLYASLWRVQTGAL